MGYLIQNTGVKDQILGIQSVVRILCQMSVGQFFLVLPMFNKFVKCHYRVDVKFIRLSFQLTRENCSFNGMIFH